MRFLLPPSSPRRAQIEILGWMVAEFRVSVFAQELNTAYPISPKRLDEQLEKIGKLA